MKKNLGVSVAFAVVVLVAALTAGASAQTVAAPDSALAAVFAASSMPQMSSGIQQKAAACGPFCDTSIHAMTTTISGSGPDCTTAQSSLNSQLTSIANADCQNFWGDFRSCNLVVHNTTSCTQIAPGTFQIQGNATYSCRDTTC